MRVPFYDRLPKIWKRLDHYGVLERFLGVWDSEFEFVHGKITELMSVKDPNVISDKFLFLLADIVGHRWRSDKTRAWNRAKILLAINRHSYKGSYGRIKDTVVEYTSPNPHLQIQDNASILLVVGTQGLIGGPDSYLEAADFYHSGVFVLTIEDTNRWAEIRADLEELIPAGERWYFILSSLFEPVYDLSASLNMDGFESQHNVDGLIGFASIGDSSWISFEETGDDAFGRIPVFYTEDTAFGGGSIGFTPIGADLFLSFESVGAELLESNKVHWDFFECYDGSLLGDGILGEDLWTSYTSESAMDMAVSESGFGVVGGLAQLTSTLDLSYDVHIGHGSGLHPLDAEEAVKQSDGEIS